MSHQCEKNRAISIDDYSHPLCSMKMGMIELQQILHKKKYVGKCQHYVEMLSIGFYTKLST